MKLKDREGIKQILSQLDQNDPEFERLSGKLKELEMQIET